MFESRCEIKHNPWESVTLNDYEAHMSLPEVKQLQALNAFMKKQLEDVEASTAAIIGVAGGNGLEYIDPQKYKTVYGIDVNEEFLQMCVDRFQQLKDCLVLEKKDLMDLDQAIPEVEYVIANLVIEYVGVETFARQVVAAKPKWVSCVIQKNSDQDFVSESAYTQAFDGISAIHRDIEETVLTCEMKKIGYQFLEKEIASLPNGKQLIRLNYSK